MIQGNNSFADMSFYILELLVARHSLGFLNESHFNQVFEPSFDSQVREYPMGDYESILNERGSMFPLRGNVDSYLRSYIYSPAFYLLSVARAMQIVEAHCLPEEPPKVRRRRLREKGLVKTSHSQG